MFKVGFYFRGHRGDLPGITAVTHGVVAEHADGHGVAGGDRRVVSGAAVADEAQNTLSPVPKYLHSAPSLQPKSLGACPQA
jgi:hypothetical protein